MELIQKPSQMPTVQRQVVPEVKLNSVAQDFTQATADQLAGQQKILEGVTNLVNNVQSEMYATKQADLEYAISKKTLEVENEMSKIEPYLGTHPKYDKQYNDMMEKLRTDTVDTINRSGLNKTEQLEFLRGTEQQMESKKAEYERTRAVNQYTASVQSNTFTKNTLNTKNTQQFKVEGGEISGNITLASQYYRALENESAFSGYNYDEFAKKEFLQNGMIEFYTTGFDSFLKRVGAENDNLILQGEKFNLTANEIIPALEESFSNVGKVVDGRVELSDDFRQSIIDETSPFLSDDAQRIQLENYRSMVESYYSTNEANKQKVRNSLLIPMEMSNKINKDIMKAMTDTKSIEDSYSSDDPNVTLTAMGLDAVKDGAITNDMITSWGIYDPNQVSGRTSTGNYYLPASDSIISDSKGVWEAINPSQSYVGRYEQYKGALSQTLGYDNPERLTDIYKQLSSERPAGIPSGNDFDYLTAETFSQNDYVNRAYSPALRMKTDADVEVARTGYKTYQNMTGSNLTDSEFMVVKELATYKLMADTGLDQDRAEKLSTNTDIPMRLANVMRGIENDFQKNPDFKRLALDHWNPTTTDTNYQKMTANRGAFYKMANDEKLINQLQGSVAEVLPQIIDTRNFTPEEINTVNKFLSADRPSFDQWDSIQSILDSKPSLGAGMSREYQENLRAVQEANDLYLHFKSKEATEPSQDKGESALINRSITRGISTAESNIKLIRDQYPAPENQLQTNTEFSATPEGLGSFIKSFEVMDGQPAPAYADNRASGNFSWGYGTEAPEGTEEGASPSPEQAEEDFQNALSTAQNDVMGRTRGLDLSQNQLNALTSMYYNLGSQMFVNPDGTPTGLNTALQSGDNEQVAREMMRYVYSNGEKLEGLEKRRRAEAEMFLTERPAEQIAIKQKMIDLEQDPQLNPIIQQSLTRAQNLDQMLSGIVVLDQQKKALIEHNNATVGLEPEQKAEVERELGKKYTLQELDNLANPNYVSPLSRTVDMERHYSDATHDIPKSMQALDKYVTGKKKGAMSDKAWNKHLDDSQSLISTAVGMVGAGIGATVGSMVMPVGGSMVGAVMGSQLGEVPALVMNSRVGQRFKYNLGMEYTVFRDTGIPQELKNTLSDYMYNETEQLGELDDPLVTMSPTRYISLIEQGIRDTQGMGADSMFYYAEDEYQRQRALRKPITDAKTVKDKMDVILDRFNVSYETLGIDPDEWFNSDGTINQSMYLAEREMGVPSTTNAWGW